jgi:hypothetical protein
MASRNAFLSALAWWLTTSLKLSITSDNENRAMEVSCLQKDVPVHICQ